MIGTTCVGHMLEGDRIWRPGVRQIENSAVVTLESIAYERKIGVVNSLGAQVMGTEEQMKVWDLYFLNFAKAYGATAASLEHAETDSRSTTNPLEGR